LRILVLSSLCHSLVNFRGQLLAAMVSEGHEVLACAPDRDSEVIRRLEGIGVRFAQTPMARAGNSIFRDLQTLVHFIGLILKERPGLVMAYTQKPIIFGGIATRLLGGCRFVALVSGLGYVFSPAADHRRGLRRLVTFLYKASLKRASPVFVFNSADGADLLKLGIVSPRHRVIQVPGSGVDLNFFTSSPLPSRSPTFLMVARLMRDKGVVEFIEAARQVKAGSPEARFLLLGRCEPENPTGFAQDEVEQLLAGSCVELCPETKDVRPYLSACTAFVLPSYYREGLPRTILEAMATGRPIITTDLPGCRDAVDDGSNGILVPARNSDALARAMSRIVADPAAASKMGVRSRELAQRYAVGRVNKLLLQEMGLDACGVMEEVSVDLTPRSPARAASA
jgi:glycosyltransferase involved in cell wall biosynthesis